MPLQRRTERTDTGLHRADSLTQRGEAGMGARQTGTVENALLSVAPTTSARRVGRCGTKASRPLPGNARRGRSGEGICADSSQRRLQKVGLDDGGPGCGSPQPKQRISHIGSQQSAVPMEPASIGGKQTRAAYCPTSTVAHRHNVSVGQWAMVLLHRRAGWILTLYCALGATGQHASRRRNPRHFGGVGEVSWCSSLPHSRQRNSIHQQRVSCPDQAVRLEADLHPDPSPAVEWKDGETSSYPAGRRAFGSGTQKPTASPRYHCRVGHALQSGAAACWSVLLDPRGLAGWAGQAAIGGASTETRGREEAAIPTQREAAKGTIEAGRGLQAGLRTGGAQATRNRLSNNDRGLCPRTPRIYRFERSRLIQSRQLGEVQGAIQGIRDLECHLAQGVSTVFRPVGAQVASQQSPILPLAWPVYFRRQKSQYPDFQKVSFRLKQNNDQ